MFPTYVNILKNVVGAGILGVPYAVSTFASYGLGALVLLFTLCFATLNLWFLMRAADRVQELHPEGEDCNVERREDRPDQHVHDLDGPREHEQSAGGGPRESSSRSGGSDSLLVQREHELPSSYAALALAAWGPRGARISDIVVLCYSCGLLVAYGVLLADFFTQGFAHLLPDSSSADLAGFFARLLERRSVLRSVLEFVVNFVRVLEQSPQSVNRVAFF